MSTKKKAAKPAAPKTPKVEITPTTKLAFGKARDRGGPRTAFVELAKKAGTVTAAKLQAQAEKELELPAKRTSIWIGQMVRRGVLRVVA